MTSNTNSNNYQPIQHSLILGGNSSSINSLGVATSGQIPIGSTGSDPVLGTITAGTNISINTGAGSITINSSSAPIVASSLALTQFDMIDDFIYTYSPAITTDNAIFGDIWNVRLSGTSASVDFNQGSGTSNSPGWIQLNTGTSTTGKSGIRPNNGSTPLKFPVVGTTTIILAYIPTLSNGTDSYTINTGLMDSVQTTPGNGCYFSYTDSVNSGKWVINCTNGGTTTSVNTTTAPTAGAWHNYTVIVNSAASSVSFFIDGVQVGSSITTHIPGASISQGIAIFKNAGTTNRSVEVDLMSVNQVFSSPRPG